MSQRAGPRTCDKSTSPERDRPECPLQTFLAEATFLVVPMETELEDAKPRGAFAERSKSRRGRCCRRVAQSLLRERVVRMIPWMCAAFLFVTSVGLFLEDMHRPGYTKIREGIQLVRWNALTAAKAKMERYGNVRDPQELERMPAWVVSLKSPNERREKVRRQMAGQRLNYSFVDAIDGMREEIPPEELQWFLSSGRAYEGGTPFQRKKIATDVTNLRLLHRMLADNVPIAMIMEDDFVLPQGDLLQRLNATMAQLPVDWDLFALNACSMRKHGQTLGQFVGEGVRVLKTGSCTLCVVINRAAAVKVLKASERQLNYQYFDNLLIGYMAQTGSFNSYLADPPLCLFDSSSTSVIEPGREPFRDILP